MRLPHAWRPKLTLVVLVNGVVIPTAPQPRAASAFERYNDGCHKCHGSFLDGTSPRGTVFPADSKHAMHANVMSAQCSLCHRIDDNWDPYIGSSDGTPYNPPVGCTGCHGRDYGTDTGNSGVGLRAHHASFGVNECATCHEHDPTPLPENVAPSYYGTLDTEVDDPCNGAPNHLENWSIGDAVGLDNDGDGLFDGGDNDCCPGDIDVKGCVNLQNVSVFSGCMAGPDEPLSANCQTADVDGDADADMADFSVLQRALR